MKESTHAFEATSQTTPRERFSSRFGFLMLSAACAIGLGNVWRFPYITGKYGGGIFVVVYALFLLAVLPVMIMEFAVGRASKASMGKAFHTLELQGSHWHRLGFWALLGSYGLMMFYMAISGWMLAYCVFMANGTLSSLSTPEIGSFFQTFLQNPTAQSIFLTLCIGICFSINAAGLNRGVERIIKIMMIGLFILLTILVVRVLFLPEAGKGLSYFLLPDWERFSHASFFEICNAAMCQAFFTLGIGIGCMTTIGSYYTKEKSLTGEAICIASLDTVVALMAGLLIFPACFSFNINPDSGPGLIFITLPNVFNNMPEGRLWGALFFLFMTFASFSTVIAVIETILSYSQDVFGMSRKKAALIHGCILWVLSLPCVFSWSVLSGITPFGSGSTILDLEDFIVSSNLLPLGALIFTLFCTLKRGWGWKSFIKEVNQGEGVQLPGWFRIYCQWILPCILILVFLAGYAERFWK